MHDSPKVFGPGLDPLGGLPLASDKKPDVTVGSDNTVAVEAHEHEHEDDSALMAEPDPPLTEHADDTY